MLSLAASLSDNGLGRLPIHEQGEEKHGCGY
jgi:hypothetical protein